jgi:hypothetical protein
MDHEEPKPNEDIAASKTPERRSIAGIATASAKLSFARARVQAAAELLIPRLGQLNPDALSDPLTQLISLEAEARDLANEIRKATDKRDNTAVVSSDAGS